MQIDKVITVYLKPQDMERLNAITYLDAFTANNWIDYPTIRELPEIRNYLSTDEYKAMKNGRADFIAFRMDY